jgi:hypothetical protein
MLVIAPPAVVPIKLKDLVNCVRAASSAGIYTCLLACTWARVIFLGRSNGYDPGSRDREDDSAL